MQYVVTGASGLIGRTLASRLERDGKPVRRLARPAFDLTRRATFEKLDFGGAIVLDCAACIDASPERIRAVNVDGLAELLKICDAAPPKQYLYFSTTSTQIPEQVEKSAYVRSKLEGEKMVLARAWGKVVRLTFPFGPGEGPNRLVTRLIRNIAEGERVAVGNVKLTLTPLSLLEEHIDTIIESGKRELTPTNGATHQLSDVVDAIFRALGKKPEYTLDHSSRCDLTVGNEDMLECDADAIQSVQEMAKSYCAGQQHGALIGS